MILCKAGDFVEVMKDVESYEDVGLNKALSQSRKIPSGSFGSVLSVLTNTAGDGRILCVSFGDRVSYVLEGYLRPVNKHI